MQWMGLMMMMCCGMTLKRLQMLGVSVRKKEALTMKMDIVN